MKLKFGRLVLRYSRNLVTEATLSNNAFVCNEEIPHEDYYDQINGVAMGSPLGLEPITLMARSSISEHFHV